MLSRNVARTFSSAAAARSHSSATPTIQENVTVLRNGLKVASVDLHGAISQLVIAYPAGSRYQQVDEEGLVHTLRNCVGYGSRTLSTSAELLWHTGDIGSSLSSTISKDFFTVQMSVARNHADKAVQLLGLFSVPLCEVWDILEVRKIMSEDLQQQTPMDIVVELLHKAAYRNGSLANSVISPEYAVGQVKATQLYNYITAKLTFSNAVLVGVNVDHDVLLDYVSNTNIKGSQSAKSVQPSKYFGGEVRQSGKGSNAHVAIAGPGAPLSDVKAVAVQCVLSYVIGKGPNVKYANAPGLGPVAKKVLQVANLNPVGVNALNISHSDSGLVGVYLVASGSQIGQYVKAAVSGLKDLASSGPDEDTLTMAKKMAELTTHLNAQDTSQLAADQAAQLLATGNSVSPSEFVKSIQDVTADDVKKAAAKLTSKLSIASYGKIHQVPYIDEI